MTLERVLIVHNAYQHAGGEDSVVADEAALLRRKGHEVIELRRDNHAIAGMGRLRLAANTLWSSHTYRDATALLRRHRPDVVHVHNTFALISPSLYWACDRMGVPVVQTLHNFRLACPQATLLREGRICENCVGRTPWPALRHGCYHDSRAQTAVVVAMLGVHRAIGTYREKVSRYIALNEFCRAKFVQSGLPADRITVKPNFAEVAPETHPQARHGFLYVGRLSPEKGIDVLGQAWQGLPGAGLRVAGTGPRSAAIDTLAARDGVAMLGALTPAEVQREMRSALALVLPSICYENFPRTLVEAYGAGLPVIASRLGALADLVEHGVTGLLYEPGDAQGLAEAMRWAGQHPHRMLAMGANARLRFEALYTPDINYVRLAGIYRSAIADTPLQELSP